MPEQFAQLREGPLRGREVDAQKVLVDRGRLWVHADLHTHDNYYNERFRQFHPGALSFKFGEAAYDYSRDDGQPRAGARGRCSATAAASAAV